ncbi:PREDICTED: EF-hand and coiled-coil domain-containing protein 1-like [Galeopterus variegatus]|uniref:EF-hand and coiled-coil domain-containing protein 1-like n=1 Tax=Galeopterus variegatus TaxID=482537 RepID=A0ABM0S8V0_GALVR|nr:PREDICTED: EF-hand and coiled-coil domain-containing protein 1-like [Galeopterus variegatus]
MREEERGDHRERRDRTVAAPRGPRGLLGPIPQPPPKQLGAEGERVARLEEENSSLRELVEDLRAALQSSDARCLALQVGLWKSQAGAQVAGRGGTEAAAARELVITSLHRVRELEALARQVPDLQRWVRQLEAELRRYRSEGPQLPTSPRASLEQGGKSGEPQDDGTSDPDAAPEGAWQSDSSSGSRALDEAGEQLFRSVEGQAASDEEEEADEEEKRREEQKPLVAEAKTLLVQLSSCGRGCDDQTAKKLISYFGRFDGADHACTLGELEACMSALVEQLGTQGCSGKTQRTSGEEAELQRKVEENEHLRLELQLVETERVRLSLLEEKLVDVLQLLQRLRDLNISRRSLGKILLSTLDPYRDPIHEGRPGPSAILDALHQALAGCELLQRQPLESASTAPVLTNPLLISY